MGCASSSTSGSTKEDSATPGSTANSGNPSRANSHFNGSGSPGSATSRCHFCGRQIAERDYNAHTVRCDDREVTCGNSWCHQIVRQGDLSKHMEECGLKQMALCPKCGVQVLAVGMPNHRDACQPKLCKDCGELCITRIHKWCPNLLISKMKVKNGPFATEALKEKYKSPSDKAKINFNVARMQLLWRWIKCKGLIEETVFRAVYKEMDLKKEGFAIFKAQDKVNDSNLVAPKRSRSVLQVPVVAPASTAHYFPVVSSKPITLAHVERLLEDMRNRVLLPYPAAWRIFTEALSVLDKLPNVVHVSPAEGARNVNGRVSQGCKVVVVGDLHGQVDDLLHILKESGLPSESNYYIFNGDFVDRGQYGVEILLVLFSLLLSCPRSVSLNRGNHECDYMNDEYGFDVEVSTKYDRNMFRLIQRCFCALPLATVVRGSIFVVHGGLPRRKGVTIRDIDRIQRFRQVPMPELSQPEEDEIFQDLLWSDPVEDIEDWRESQRGAGVEFGRRVTEEFLANNNLQLVLRSHEDCPVGYMEHHNKKLITIFSASNYDGPESNQGSICTFVGHDLDPSYHSYQIYEAESYEEMMLMNVNDSVSSPTSSTMVMFGSFAGPAGGGLGGHLGAAGGYLTTSPTFGGTSNLAAAPASRSFSRRRTKNTILRELRELVFQRRHRLLVYFSKLDRTNKGSVWIIEWVDAMRNILNLDLPWYFLRPFLTQIENNRISYAPFLRGVRNMFQNLWINDWQQSVCSRLVQQQRSSHRSQMVSEAFTNPAVTYSEFCSVLRAIDYGMSDAVLYQLFQLFDTEDKGHVRGPEVLRKLQAIAEEQPGPLRWDVDAVDQLLKIVIQARNQLPLMFKIVGRDRYLTKEKFMNGMALISQGMRKQLTQPQKDRIYEFLGGTFLMVMYFYDKRITTSLLTTQVGCAEMGITPFSKNLSFSGVPAFLLNTR
eukprot:gene12230-8417_t